MKSKKVQIKKFDLKKFSFLGAFALAVLLVVVVTLRAQTNPPSLVLHPSNVDVNLNPGAPTTGILYLRNTTPNALIIQTTLENFTAQGEEGGVTLTNEDTGYSLAKWITIIPSKTQIAPGQEIAFRYTITPPKNAEPGGHFGSIVFSTVPGKSINGSAGSEVSQEIAALFLATVPGPVVENASILSFAPQNSFYEYGPVNFSLRVKDEGGVHIRPAGVVTVTDMLGNKSVFGFEGEDVLPGAIRNMPVAFDKTWLIGKYNVELALAYGSKNTQLYATTSFYAFPWKVGLVILVVILLLLFMRKRIWKAFKVIAKG